MNFNYHVESPFEIKVGFQKLINQYKSLKDSKNVIIANTAKTILKHVEEKPALQKDFTSFEELDKHERDIKFLLQDLFHPALTNNEIKAATIPFNDHAFMKSERFKSLTEQKDDDFKLEIKNMDSSNWYIIASSIILKTCYNYEINFKRPFFYEIPDENGVVRYYKILFNAEFVDIVPKPNAPNITHDDYLNLIDNFENKELWKEKFPPNSYEFKGFLISNVFDVTDDQSISNIKTALIGQEKRQNGNFMNTFHNVFSSLLGLQNIKVGFSIYDESNDNFEKVYGIGMNSYLINNDSSCSSKSTLCSWSYKRLLIDKKFFSISDVEKVYNNSKDIPPHVKSLHKQDIKSAIFAPIANDKSLLGILEIVSHKPHVLNSVNAQKLVDVMPFIVSAVERSKKDEENLIEAIIQKECTSIHSSVHWKFENEAKSYIKQQLMGNEPSFKSITFRDIYPLYGQIDISKSSEARNNATINDLNLQLQNLKHIFIEGLKFEKIPIYENFLFQINSHLSGLNEYFQVDSEQEINNYIQNEIHPVLTHLGKSEELKNEINAYINKIDKNTGGFYEHRKQYDDTVKSINKVMATALDEKQQDAQNMFPHYYERFKTDGVEHNMYVGESISKEGNFNPVYLYNLRLWQLQVMCEMENTFYQIQSEFPVKLDVVSMILVFSQPLTISFRMDEKQFDVDGTYNARYEIVKKRVDKAFIKGTTERITQKGKMSIIYSQKQDEIEYMSYIKFLQAKKYLGEEIEIVELQDLQAVSGLKAIRVNILYKNNDRDKEFYTYNDLMSEINQ